MNVKRYLLPDFTVILNFISTCKNRGMFIKRKINTQVKITHTNMFNNTGKKYWFKYFMMWAHDYLVLLIKSIRHRTTGSIILHSQKIINICHIHAYRYIFIYSYVHWQIWIMSQNLISFIIGAWDMTRKIL